MLKRHAIQVLRQAGHSLPEVPKLAGVSVRSVQRVENEGAVRRDDNPGARSSPGPRVKDRETLPRVIAFREYWLSRKR